MGNEDKNAVTRAHFSVLDAALVLLVLLTALAVWQSSNLAYVFEADRTQRSYTVAFEITAVRYDAIEPLAANTALFTNTAHGAVELGTLTDEPTVLPRVTQVAGEDGAAATDVLILQNEPHRLVDLNGTFLSRGVMREGALVIGDVTLSVGSDVAISAERSFLQIRVLSISENR